MKQFLYLLAAIGICVCLLPVLLVRLVWEKVWDALDTAFILSLIHISEPTRPY